MQKYCLTCTGRSEKKRERGAGCSLPSAETGRRGDLRTHLGRPQRAAALGRLKMPGDRSTASSIRETARDREPWGGRHVSIRSPSARPPPPPTGERRRSCASSDGPAPGARPRPAPVRASPSSRARPRARSRARSRRRRRHFGAISPAAPSRSRAGPEPPAGCARVRRRRAAGRGPWACGPSAGRPHVPSASVLASPRASEEPPRPSSPHPPPPARACGAGECGRAPAASSGPGRGGSPPPSPPVFLLRQSALRCHSAPADGAQSVWISAFVNPAPRPGWGVGGGQRLRPSVRLLACVSQHAPLPSFIHSFVRSSSVPSANPSPS